MAIKLPEPPRINADLRQFEDWYRMVFRLFSTDRAIAWSLVDSTEFDIAYTKSNTFTIDYDDTDVTPLKIIFGKTVNKWLAHDGSQFSFNDDLLIDSDITISSGSITSILGSIDFGNEALTTLGVITALSFESTEVTGIAPLVIASTTKVTNLNVDFLDDQSGAYYLDSANFTGTSWTDLTDAGDTTLHSHAASGIDHNSLANLTTGDVHTQYLLRQPTANVIINDSGGDFNLRIEGDTEENLLFIDAGLGTVGIGTNEFVAGTSFQIGHNTGTGSGYFYAGVTGFGASYAAAGIAGFAAEFLRARGNIGTPVIVNANDKIFEYSTYHYNGGYINGGSFGVKMDGSQTTETYFSNYPVMTIGQGTAGIDYRLKFDGETNDGIIDWMEDEDYFKFSDDILMNSTEAIYFRDTALHIDSLDDGHLDLTADISIDMNGAVIGTSTIDCTGYKVSTVAGVDMSSGTPKGVVVSKGIITAATSVSPAADGTYALPTSITISGGIITAIS